MNAYAERAVQTLRTVQAGGTEVVRIAPLSRQTPG